MPIKRRKISELEEAKDLTGFFTIGYRVLNGVKKSVKYGLEHIQTAYENMLKAMDEAKEATTDMRLLEATVQENEEDRETVESRRDASEQGRCNEEEKRVEAENIRKIAESKRVEAESGRVTEEDARHNSELVRINAESLRVSQENTRKVTETNRVNVEATRVAEEGKRVIAEKGRVDAEAIRIAEFTTLKQNAETATSDANETANHPTYIGTDHYVYKWNKSTKAYDKMDIYCKGDAFSIKRVYSSIAALQADVNNMEVEIGDFVLVNTNNVEDPDNAKLYVKNKKIDGTYSYDFLVDMSGAIGFTGKTPQISIGTVSKGSNPVVTLSEDGVDGDGNPKYKLNLVLPQGEKGEAPVLEVGTVTTGTSGSQASATLEPNGLTSTGAPKYRLNMAIPQGPQGTGNMQVSVSGLVSGKTYLFKPSANNSAVGTLVEFSQAQADWDVTDTSLPSFIKNKPSSFTPSAHKHKKSEITDFPTSMPASDVYDWAKQQNKPSYTASEVGALPSDGIANAAIKLQTARAINGVAFDGTKDIGINYLYPAPIFANMNLNAITVPGMYYCGANDIASTVVNSPTNHAFSLLVEQHAGFKQTVTTYDSDTTQIKTYSRNYNGQQWTAWYRIYTTVDNPIMDDIGDATQGPVALVHGSYKRKVIVCATKPDGWVSRIALGIFGQRGSFGPCLLSVGINDSGTSYRDFVFYNSGQLHCEGGFFKDSDIRLKKDIKPLNHTLDQILAIPTASFIMDGTRQIGTIAQKIEKICPEIVSDGVKRKSEVPDNDDWEVEIREDKGEKIEYVKTKKVEYEMLAVLALEGLKLLNRKVEDLRNEILNK
ncbi:tail fiber domain-containing protein [Parabacteroides sp. APC149_11_2_Y6]